MRNDLIARLAKEIVDRLLYEASPKKREQEAQWIAESIAALSAQGETAPDIYYSMAEALLLDQPLLNGEYVHLTTCNANRREPVGNGGCSCPLGGRIRSLRAAQGETAPAPADTILDHWNDSGRPSVENYNHAVDVANANWQRAEQLAALTAVSDSDDTTTRNKTAVITVPPVTFVAGDARPDLLTALAASALRPIYGPKDAAGRRSLIGALEASSVERFAEMIAVADAKGGTPDA